MKTLDGKTAPHLTKGPEQTAPARPSDTDSPSYNTLLIQGEAQFNAGQFQQAAQLYSQALDKAGPTAVVLIRLADICIKTGALETAETHLATLRTIAPAFPWTPLIEADLAMCHADSDRALVHLRDAHARMPDNAKIKTRLDKLAEEVEKQRTRTAPAPLRIWPAKGPADFLTATPQERVLVVSWDIAHNVVGRGITMAETISDAVPTAVAGPMFPMYGTQLWPPLADADRTVPIIGWNAPHFRHLVEGCLRLVQEWPAKTVWISKPRFPSMLIGLLYKHVHGATVLCDLDDDELAFVNGEAPRDFQSFFERMEPQDWQRPQGKIWTELGMGMVPMVDGLTACNPVLSARHGAALIRHGRRDADAERAIAARAQTRLTHGFAPQDRVVLFLGTPRRHKGLLELAQAVVAQNDPDLVLCIAGSAVDIDMENALKALPGLRLKRLYEQPFSRVLDLNAMADLVVLLQDRESPISQSQTPAKLTDAVAVGSPVLLTDVPPVADVIKAGAAMAIAKGEVLSERLRAVLAQPRPQGVHPFFAQEMAYGPNQRRALDAITTARQSTKRLTADAGRLLRFIDTEMPGVLPADLSALAAPHLRSAPPLARTIDPDKPINVAFFWKQNDSGLYGRRQDMLVRELARRPEIGRVLHIDAPIAAKQLQFNANPMRPPVDNERQMTSANALLRLAGLADEGNLFRRSFVMGTAGDTVLGTRLLSPDSFPNVVESWLRGLDMVDNCIAWVCPVVDGFSDVQARLNFPFILSDYIDDQRFWTNSALKDRMIRDNYRFMAQHTDLALANCVPVADALAGEGLQTLMVPNGVDTPAAPPRPADEITRLGGPVVGYCGNMNDRFDFDLVESLSRARPDVQIVLIGKLSLKAERARMLALPNVHVLGVRRHDAAQACIAGFDVAIVPHIRNDMSDRMNPLKVYVYRSLGVPVVTSGVANLDDMQGEIRAATDTDGFIHAVNDALIEASTQPRKQMPDALKKALSWESKMDTIWAHVDERLRARFP